MDNFNITNSTLNLAVAVNNSPTNIAVNNLNVGATGGTINISSLPPVGAYPTTFRLINYANFRRRCHHHFNLGPLPGTFTRKSTCLQQWRRT